MPDAPQILHISDVHGRPGFDSARLAEGIAQAVYDANGAPDFLVVSGDLGFKGAHQDIGSNFVRELARNLSLPSDRIVVCPGNHDLELNRRERGDDPFHSYKKAVFEIFRHTDRAVASPAWCHSSEGVDFFVINSSSHHDHSHGKVNIGELARLLGNPRTAGLRIVIVHHHAIPVLEEDRSAIVNAYEFLCLLVNTGIDLLLHGHHHMALSLIVGKRVKMVGVGSVNYPPEQNLNNQFNLLTVGKQIVRFRYTGDALNSKGRLGAWKPIVEPW